MQSQKIDESQGAEENFKFWKLSSRELLKHFCQTENGYDNRTLEELGKKYEPNILEEEEKESVLEKILEQFGDPLVKILLGAAAVSFILALTGDHEEGIAAFIEPLVILLILIANATIGVWQDINADKAIEALKKMQASRCTVRRGGKNIEIDAKDLFPGDLVVVNEGEKVPADVRLIEILTSNFETNESNLTGESQSVYKTNDGILEDKRPVVKDMRNMIFSSTGITTGSAIGIVINTGMKTEIGLIQKLMKDAKEDEEKSPLAQKLDEFGNHLTYIIGAICVIVWLINYKNFFDESHGTMFNGMIYYFKISVALAVAAIPEGLPAVITTCFALGSRRMSANNAIVRKLDAIETLGCTSVICSDKTGTLTTNNMSVTKFMVLDHQTQRIDVIREVTGTSFKPEGKVLEFDSQFYQNSHNLKLATLCAALCNTSEIRKENGVYSIKGSPTEGALRVFSEKMRIYHTGYSSESDDPMGYIKFLSNEYKILYNLEFDRNRKAMSVLALHIQTNKPVLFTKGAPEILLNQCVSYYKRNGQLQDMDRFDVQHINQKIKEEFMSKSLRSIALCIKENLKELDEIDFLDRNVLKTYFKDRQKIRDLEKDLTYLGVVGMIDPPRPEVKNAISTCYDAGIRVIMITGDNKDTAEAIGTDIGILSTKNDLKTSSFTTSQFFSMSEDEQLKVLKSNSNIIFSRSEPKHKMQLVKKLKELDHIVAMTGDGVNDAPALAESHIGVAMGIAGTDVAKEASHIILADDNFATIVKAVEEGRSIYMNMKAFIRYLISSNIGEVVAIFITSACGIPEAFTSIQLLWVNLVTDGPPATALGFNPPEKHIMKKPPRAKDDALINAWIIFRYFVIGTYVGCATIGIFIYWYLYFQHADGHTLITWNQLTHWTGCEKWTDFAVDSFSGIDLKNPCDYFTVGKTKAVTLSLTVLVIIEMFNAMNAVSDEASLLHMPPYKNKWLIVAIFFSVSLHCAILYIPFFNKIFGIMPLDAQEWGLVLIFSIPVVFIDELIKFYARLSSPSKRKIKVE